MPGRPGWIARQGLSFLRGTPGKHIFWGVPPKKDTPMKFDTCAVRPWLFKFHKVSCAGFRALQGNQHLGSQRPAVLAVSHIFIAQTFDFLSPCQKLNRLAERFASPANAIQLATGKKPCAKQGVGIDHGFLQEFSPNESYIFAFGVLHCDNSLGTIWTKAACQVSCEPDSQKDRGVSAVSRHFFMLREAGPTGGIILNRHQVRPLNF